MASWSLIRFREIKPSRLGLPSHQDKEEALRLTVPALSLRSSVMVSQMKMSDKR